MSITVDVIISKLYQRRSQDSVLIRQMVDTRDRYNGDITLPLPDVANAPTLTATTARLISIGVDALAMQAAETRPTIYTPALNIDSARSRQNAEDRRRALYGGWHNSALHDVLLYRSFRHLAGYGTNSFIVMPDFHTGRARIEIRDPLTVYPELRAPDDWHPPANVGFIFARSKDWILSRYPNAEQYIRKGLSAQNWDTLWDMFEWIDEDDIVIGILGPRQPAFSPQDARSLGYYGYEIKRWPNKAGMVPVACNRRVTLDRIQGQLAALTGLHDLMDRLNALDIIATERAIFPDMVALSADGRVAQVVNGSWRDGRTGEVNLLSDARDVKYMQAAPGPMTNPIIDRIERNIRISGGVSPFSGGENDNSLRTGKALDTMSAFSTNPRVAEAQHLMGRSLMAVNEGFMAVEKGYFSGRKIVSFSGWPTEQSVVKYDPGKIFETFENIVSWNFPGSDLAQVSIAVGQLVGDGLMSKSTGRRKHPYIEDPDAEEREIIMETVDGAVLQAFAQQLASGQVQLVDGLKVRRYLDNGQDLVEALEKAHNDAQNRQATHADAPQPGQQTAPEAQPGIQGGPPGAQQPVPPAIGAPSQSLLDNRRLVQALMAGRGA